MLTLAEGQGCAIWSAAADIHRICTVLKGYNYMSHVGGGAGAQQARSLPGTAPTHGRGHS